MLSRFSLTLCDPMDYNPPGSSVHGIFQARILECVAVSFPRGSFPSNRDRTRVSRLLRQQAGPLPSGPLGWLPFSTVIFFCLKEQGGWGRGRKKKSRSTEQSEHTPPLLSPPSYMSSSCGSSAISMGTSKITDHRSPRQISQLKTSAML